MDPSLTSQDKVGRKRHLKRRLLTGIILSAICLVGIFALINMQSASLRNSSWTTGYILIACLFFLAAYNLRKKVPFLPRIGTSRMWMQLHIYVALISIGIFVGHIGFRIPDGSFEQLLAALYVIVAGSGIYGLYVTRTVPRKLTAVNNEVIFEQIPTLKRTLIQRARQLVMKSAESTDVLAKFYVNQLIYFFEKPRSLAYQLSPSLRRSKQLATDVKNLDRYLSEPQRVVSRELTELIRAKEDLDYHWALQGKLKVWLFVHIGLTYSLLIVAVLHGVMAHSFGGGLR